MFNRTFPNSQATTALQGTAILNFFTPNQVANTPSLLFKGKKTKKII